MCRWSDGHYEQPICRDTRVASITHTGETIFLRADTRLAAGDVALILVEPASEPALRAFLAGSPTTS